MCVHNVDGQRGWNAECPAASTCLCGYFPEVGPAFPQPRRSPATGTARTLVHIVVGAVAVLLAIITLGVLVIGTSDDERRPRSAW